MYNKFLNCLNTKVPKIYPKTKIAKRRRLLRRQKLDINITLAALLTLL